MMKKLFVFALALSLICGSAWAWDMEDHVIMAPNGKGDAIVFPLYAAASGYETNFWVTNTSDVYSTVAKVVFRSPAYTQELLDFFIFLSPNDVFKATIRNTESGVVVYSNDDSVISSLQGGTTAVWGDTTPLSRILANPPCENTTGVGYIEVFETAFYPYAKQLDGTVAKTTILNGYGGVQGLNDATATYNAVEGLYVVANPINNVAAMYVATQNILAGHMEIGVPGNALSSAVRAEVFRNYDTSLYAKQTLGVETYLGDSFAHNTTGEVEAAMSRNDLHMPFSHRSLTYHFITFPTKKTLLNTATCTVTGWIGPYFNEVLSVVNGVATDNCVDYDATDYDMMEHSQISGSVFSPLGSSQTSQFCSEVNYGHSYNYDEGWVRYVFEIPADGSTDSDFAANRGADCTTAPCVAYRGVPVIGTVLDFGMGMNMISAAYTDTDVWEINDADGNADGNTINYYYQYWDRAHLPYESGTPTWGYRSGNGLPTDQVNTPWPSFPSVADPNGDAMLP